MADPAANLGSRLRQTRERHGLSVNELARRSGVQASVISQLENGQRTNIRSDRLRQLAETLEVSLDYLMGISEKERLDPECIGTASLRGTELVEAVPGLSQ